MSSLLTMKKTEKQLESTKASNRNLRERVNTNALAGAAGGAAGAFVADTILDKLPRNSAEEMAELAAKKASPLAAKVVQVAAAAHAGTVLLGARSPVWAAATGVTTAVFTAAVLAYKARATGLNLGALAVKP